LIKSQRIAVSVAFLAFGAACTTWVPRLPALKDHLHLTDGQVGLALLAYAVGAVVGAAAARLVLARGARAFVQAGTVALCVALIGPGLAADFTQLFASLLLIGATAGFIDVLENAQAAELERKAGRPLINGFHGFWSLGAIIGSVSAGAAAYAGVTPLVQFIAVGGIVVVATAWILRDLPDTRSGAARVMPVDAGRLWLTGSILAVAAISLGSYLVEGGTADWSALFLSELSHANPGIAAAGFAGFSTAAAVVRFRADILTAHTSPTVVARLGASIAVVGLALAIAVPALPGAVTGFALVGIGTAVLVRRGQSRTQRHRAGTCAGVRLRRLDRGPRADRQRRRPLRLAGGDDGAPRERAGDSRPRRQPDRVAGGGQPSASPQMKRMTASMPRW